MKTRKPSIPGRPRWRGSALALALLACALFLPSAALAQVGKIAGRVTDSTTGDALPGVNVLVEGTQQGTVTDLDGNYIILNVRPGDYSLLFSYIGFAAQRVDGIRVTTDQTTRYDLEMREEVIQGEEVVVQAERPLVQKDLTASKRTVVAEEIESLPVEGFFGVLVTQAGVSTGPSGEIHIRGGRSNEVAYLVDGMSVGNPFDTNGLATTVATDAIQEMTVISGAFNAEYGKAMSGIVNLVTKEGGDRYEGSLSIYGGDTFTSHGDIFLTPESRRLNVLTMEGSLSGPVPFFRKMRFFVSARRDVDDGHIWGRREHLPSDRAYFSTDSVATLLSAIRQYIPDYSGPSWYYELHGKPWYEYGQDEEIPGELVNMNPVRTANVIAKLTTRPITGSKLEYAVLHDQARRTPFSFADRFNPDATWSTRDRSWNHSLHWTHSLGQRTFYNLRASLANNRAESYLYKDPTDPRYVAENLIQGFPGFNFNFGGNDKGYVVEESRSLRVKADITRQFGLIHEAKFGLDFQRHGLDRENFVIQYDGFRYTEPTVEPDTTVSHDRYVDQRVTELAFYAQDKLEFENFIVNVGLRYERFDPHGKYISNLLDPRVPYDQLADATVKQLLLPRIGVSFPITDTGIIHFSYGHFAQMPSLRSMYVEPEFDWIATGGVLYGNTNIRPERTVQYEMGLQQQLGDLIAVDVTGFFKDIRDYLATESIKFGTIDEQRYRMYLNKDYANVKGITVSLTKRRARGGLLSATIDYTFQMAEGNNTDTNGFFYEYLSGRESELVIVPLDFDQRHLLSGTVGLTKPGNWGISFIGQFGTGYPYTPLLIDQKIDQLPNQERKPAQLKLDAHLYKDFRIAGDARIRIFGKVFNLLDRLNERFVFDETGRASYSLSEELGYFANWESAVALNLPGIHPLSDYETRPHWYSAPREIRLGATLYF